MEEVHVQVESDISCTGHLENNSNLHTKTSIINSSPPAASFLVNLHAGYFRITVSLASQALLWKTLSHDHHTTKLGVFYYNHLPSYTYLLLWGIALVSQLLLCFFYLLRCFLHFHMVRDEFRSHVGVNYLFAPWIAWLLLLQSSPATTTNSNNSSSYVLVLLWWIFMIPVIALDVKIYGQWFTTEKRFLSAAANPTSQITVIANLVGARAAAQMGWEETAICMFSLGMIHYLVIFVTLYQRLSGRNSLPRMLRPTLFLFFGAPSMASLSWSSIGGGGGFDMSSKMLFFLSLFIFASLALRPYLFKKCMKRFNVAWWAYSFTLTILAQASAEYAKEMRSSSSSNSLFIPGMMMLLLSAISMLVFIFLFILTLLPNTRNNLLRSSSSPTNNYPLLL